jgi:hypothetical protein
MMPKKFLVYFTGATPTQTQEIIGINKMTKQIPDDPAVPLPNDWYYTVPTDTAATSADAEAFDLQHMRDLFANYGIEFFIVEIYDSPKNYAYEPASPPGS